ncbi:MAG TPA: GerMN domain-containing protein [Acidimicrobiales bacterium]|nr:GerMN domain-containing protein [Acidimicrobiales bacterium]
MNRPNPIRAAVAASLALVLAVLAGCGVPVDDAPRAISQTTVARTATVPTTIAPTGAPTVSVYFLNDGRLQAVEYPVEGEVTLGKALDYVLAAPPEEGGSGLRTSVPPGTKLRGAEVTEDGVATIDLSVEINDIGGTAQKEAFAQIVFTALGFDEVREVQFSIDGRPIDAPTDAGNLPRVSADDYQPPLNPR